MDKKKSDRVPVPPDCIFYRRFTGKTSKCPYPYHDAVAGARGEIDIVGVAGNATVPPLDVASHVLQHTVDALAGAVSAWERAKVTERDSHRGVKNRAVNNEGTLGELGRERGVVGWGGYKW